MPVLHEEDWIYDLASTGLPVQAVSDKVLGLTEFDGGRLTRRWIRPMITPGGIDGATTLEIDIHHQQRRSQTGGYKPLDRRYLRDGEWIRINLNSAETLQLYNHLDNLYAIGATGVSRRRRSLRVVDAAEVTVAGDLAEVIGRLRAEHGDEALFRHLDDLAPDLIATMALKVEHQRRLAALAEFELHLRPASDELRWTEPEWKAFFKRNEWIFGHNLDYQFLNDELPEAYVGGRRPSGGGSQLADHVMGTGGDWSFAVLVEIKRPDTPLIGPFYREGTHKIHTDLSAAVAQAQSNCQALVRESSSATFDRELAMRELSAVDPRGIVLIGDLQSLTEPAMRETFQRFRHNLWNPTVMTYDELLGRATYQVARTAPPDLLDEPEAVARPGRPARATKVVAPDAPAGRAPFAPINDVIVASGAERDEGPDWPTNRGKPAGEEVPPSDESWKDDIPF